MTMVFLILAIQITYVSFFTLRMILTLKGQRVFASLLSSLEVLIYILGLNLVLNNLGDPQNLAAYCLGYALGVYTGSIIEEKLALGYIMVEIITSDEDRDLPATLRTRGFGVTSWRAEGRDGYRLVLEVLARRKNQQRLYDLVQSINSKAFIISHEPKYFRGGFWVKNLK